MNRQKFSKDLYTFICENYDSLKNEYSYLPEKIRLKIPFAGFCVIFWDDLQDLAKNSQNNVNPELN